MKNLLKFKVALILTIIVGILTVILIIITSICGYNIGKNYIDNQVNDLQLNSNVINNFLYTDRYKSLLNKYLLSKGYVSLQRLVFYLQQTNNVLDTSTLSYELWANAYLENIDIEEKQMIPIKTICKKIEDNDNIPTFSLENGENKDGIFIEVIDLCSNIDDDKNENYYDEIYYPLPFSLPLREHFIVTSIVFEQRNIELNENEELIDTHSGWDLFVPIGTNFYSICDGTISNITNTQNNDLAYNESGNSIGNYMMVTCDNKFTAMYFHIQYNSQPFNLQEGAEVKKGDLLGKTSTTGQSTGPHLHLGLKDSEGNLLDAMAYMDFTNYEGN